MLFAFFIIKLIQLTMAIVDVITGLNILTPIIKVIANLITFLIVQLIMILILINDRKNEYNADNFALENGYGVDLIEVLYLLQKLDFSGNKSPLERLKSSHPNINNRIAKLERNLENLEEQEERKEEKVKRKQEKLKVENPTPIKVEIPVSIAETKTEIKPSNVAEEKQYVHIATGKYYATEQELVKAIIDYNTLLTEKGELQAHDINNRMEKVRELYGEDYEIQDDELPY